MYIILYTIHTKIFMYVCMYIYMYEYVVYCRTEIGGGIGRMKMFSASCFVSNAWCMEWGRTEE